MMRIFLSYGSHDILKKAPHEDGDIPGNLHVKYPTDRFQ